MWRSHPLVMTPVQPLATAYRQSSLSAPLRDSYDPNAEGKATATIFRCEILSAGTHLPSVTRFRDAALGSHWGIRFYA